MNVAAQPDGFAAFETWLGTPLPADPIAAMHTLRREAAREIERLLAFLDATDGDPDREGELAGFEAAQDGREGDDTDAEASLGWPAGGPSALDRSHEHDLDVELDQADQEPALAAPEGAKCPDQIQHWGAYVSMPHSRYWRTHGADRWRA